MGRSLTSNHIFNAEKLTKAQFKKKFTDMMKAKGYTSAKADDGEISYALAFSGDRSWVTVLTEESTDTRKEASELAKNLGMQVLSVELVDSDFAELTLYEKSGTAVDTMFLGEPYFEEYPEPSPLKWQTLLGIDWAKVEEIQQGDYTFADDALCAFGEVIGCENMLLEFDGADDDAVRLYFKKAGEKKLTLNAAFKQVFGEKLIPMGFKFIGGNSFVRVINNEVIQTVSCVKGSPFSAYGLDEGSDVRYQIWFAISTVYDDEMLLKPDSCQTGFELLHTYYIKNYDIYGRDTEYSRRIKGFGFRSYDNISILKSMNFALDAFTKIICPLLDKSTDLESNLYNFLGFCSAFNWFDLCLKLDNYVSYAEKIKSRKLTQLKYSLENGLNRINPENYNENLEKIMSEIKMNIEFLDEMYNNKEKYEEKMRAFEDNKHKNLEILKENGILVTEENEDEQIH